MRRVMALLRSGWLASTAYRFQTFMTVVGIPVAVIPMYFAAKAIQPVAGPAIAGEGSQYFAFLIVGIAAFTCMTSAVTSLPGILGTSIANGTFEALITTPTSTPALLIGLAASTYVWTAIRAAVLLLTALLLGVHVVWSAVPAALAVLALVLVAYGAIGVIGSALVVAFRTTGPLLTGVTVGSALLGGVYVPTHSMPGGLDRLAVIVPLTYALRAMRAMLLENAPFTSVARDVGILAGFAVVLVAAAAWAYGAAMQHARRAGSLAQY